MIKLKAENLSKHLFWYEKLKDLKYELNDSTINQVTNYFEDLQTPNENLIISTKFPALTLAKIFQYFEYRTDHVNQGECYEPNGRKCYQ